MDTPPLARIDLTHAVRNALGLIKVACDAVRAVDRHTCPVDPASAPYDLSPEVLRILTKKYRQDWVVETAPGRWGHWEVTWPEPEEMARAVAAGIMFTEGRALGHDGWVAAARQAAAAVTADEVGDAFLASLTSRRIDLRSALGSFALARVLPEHEYSPWRQSVGCSVCHVHIDRGPDGSIEPEDLNDLSQTRFVAAAAQLGDVKYAAFDLEQFARAPRLQPASADVAIGQQIIDYLRQLPPATTAAQAVPGLKMIPGNNGDREGLIDILGFCGILHTPEYPGYAEKFIPAIQAIASPSQPFAFGHYPTWWWKAADGINDRALRTFLPRLT